MPIKARTDMLATGIRTPVGIKLFGNDLEQLDALATEIEAVVREVPGTTSAFAERLTRAYYLDITPDLGRLAQYGVTLGAVQDMVAAALGGEIVTTILHGRERFSAIVRSPPELRDDHHRIGPQLLVAEPAAPPVNSEQSTAGK